MKYIDKQDRQRKGVKMEEINTLSATQELYSLLVAEKIFIRMMGNFDGKKTVNKLIDEAYNSSVAFTKFMVEKEKELNIKKELEKK